MSWTSGARQAKKGFPILTAIVACLVFLVAGMVARSSVGFESTPQLPSLQNGLPAVPSPAQTTLKPTTPDLPLKLLSFEPMSGTKQASPDSRIELVFSVPLSPSSPDPSLSPPVAGEWRQPRPGTLIFTPSETFVPYESVQVSIPAGPTGILGAQGQTMATSQTFSFGVGPGSVLRLQQLLAQLNYLPLEFVPQTPGEVGVGEMAMPQPGTFVWRWPTFPSSLTSIWTAGSMNILTKGAVMRFEDNSGLATDGIAGPGVWSSLLKAAQAGEVDPDPYDNVVVSTALPQTVSVYSNGAKVIQTPANTGVPAAPTVKGTFPVYLRYRSTTMSGTNPDGTHYNDPGVPWVSYFNGGQGLHGFVRPGYGYPQSVGCVEMPISAAAKVWPLTPIGTLVTVE